jgi:hypothetical protein
MPGMCMQAMGMAQMQPMQPMQPMQQMQPMAGFQQQVDGFGVLALRRCYGWIWDDMGLSANGEYL